MRRGAWVSVMSVVAVGGLGATIATCTSPGWAARRIARRNAQARGGVTAWRAVKTMTMSGKMDAGARRDPVKLAMAYRARNLPGAGKHRPVGLGMAAAETPVRLPFTMELARPNRSRLELQFQGQTAVQVYDGQEGWKLRPFLGRFEVEPYTDEELRLASQQDQLDGILIDYAAKGSRIERVRTEKLDGRDADQVRVTMANGTVRNVWVDRQSGLEVKIDGTRQLDGRPHTVWTFFRDYRNVDGRMIPHRLETVVDGVSGSETITIEKVTINPPLADARFSRPTPGQATLPASPPAGPTFKRARRTEAEIELPKVSLVRDDSQAVSFPQEIDDGKPVILNFVFTTCGTICPLMSQIFSQLQDRLGADRDRVHMVSISIDPEQDRPARLADYARRFHAGPAWRHYTGTAQASLAIQRAFDAYRGDKMNHTPVTFVRARPGSRWVRIDGFATPDELAGELRAILARR
jgi:protein SCO1/2